MLSPEQSQKFADLQSRMLANIAAGRPSHDGITKEEITEGLAFIRQNRASAVTGAAKAKAKAKAKAAKPAKPTTADKAPNANLFLNLDLD